MVKAEQIVKEMNPKDLYHSDRLLFLILNLSDHDFRELVKIGTES